MVMHPILTRDLSSLPENGRLGFHKAEVLGYGKRKLMILILKRLREERARCPLRTWERAFKNIRKRGDRHERDRDTDKG